MKVIKAAIKNSFKRKRPRAAGSSSGYDGPVNLPEGIAAAMRKTHSYMWLDNAVKDTSAPEGEAPCPLLCSFRKFDNTYYMQLVLSHRLMISFGHVAGAAVSRMACFQRHAALAPRK